MAVVLVLRHPEPLEPFAVYSIALWRVRIVTASCHGRCPLPSMETTVLLAAMSSGFARRIDVGRASNTHSC